VRTLREPEPNDVEHAGSVVFWSAMAVGFTVIGWGVYGLLVSRGGVVGVRLVPWLLWFVGLLLAHDLLVAPLAHLVGRGIRHVRPVVLRTPLQVGLALSALVTALALPLIREYGAGAQAGNDSVLPRDYTVGWLALLAAVWLGAAALTGLLSLRGRRRLQRDQAGHRSS